MSAYIASLTLLLALSGAEGGNEGLPPKLSLSVAQDGTAVRGVLTIEFRRSQRFWMSPRFGLRETIGYWLLVDFVAEDGTAFRLERLGAADKWPSEGGVRQMEAGSRVEVPFEVGLGWPYYFRDATGSQLFCLPPGQYDVRASFSVPAGGRAASRLGLEPFSSNAGTGHLIVAKASAAPSRPPSEALSPLRIRSTSPLCQLFATPGAREKLPVMYHLSLHEAYLGLEPAAGIDGAAAAATIRLLTRGDQDEADALACEAIWVAGRHARSDLHAEDSRLKAPASNPPITVSVPLVSRYCGPADGRIGVLVRREAGDASSRRTYWVPLLALQDADARRHIQDFVLELEAGEPYTLK